jgi:peptidoglycan/LPS O-acetylase OafA/YrhL
LKKIDGLTSLRAIAALWVAICHFYYQVPDGGGFVERILRLGGLGVPLFFVLSGFILSHTYQHKFRYGVSKQQLLTYGVSRFARVYPAHFTMLLLYAAVLVPTGLYPEYFYDTAASFLASLALVHAWGLYPVPVWNQPSWTVSVEFICYAAFPLIAVATARYSWRRAIGLAGIVASALVMGTLIFQGEWVFYFPLFIVKYGACFLLGCLIYFPFRDGIGKMGSVATMLSVAGAIVGIIYASTLGPRFEGFIPAFFALWIFALAAGSGPARKLFETRPFVYAGEISYSYFLAHEAALLAMLAIAEPLGFKPTDIPMEVKIAAGLVFALPLYHLVEEPGRRWIRSLPERMKFVRAPAR